MTGRHVRQAQKLLSELVKERRAAIEADHANPGGRIRGGLPAIQAEIDAVEKALADEKRRQEVTDERKLKKPRQS